MTKCPNKRKTSDSTARARKAPGKLNYLSPAQFAITHGRPGSIERLVPIGVPLTCTAKLPLAD